MKQTVHKKFLIKQLLKVSQILFSGLGGHAAVAFSLVEADTKSDWQHHLLFYGIEDLKPEYALKCRERKIPFYYIQKRPGFDFSAFRMVYQQLAFVKPDVVLLHSTNVLLPAFAYCLLNSTLLIMVEHTPNQVKRKSEWLWSWMGMAVAQKIILLTEEYKQELRSRMGMWFREKKVRVIPNGIDVDFFSPAHQPHTDKACIRISMVARFSDTKDQATLLKAFALVKKKLQHKNLELVLAGDGETRPEICSLVTELGLETCVLLPGLLNETQIRDLLRQTTIYAHASLGETMSTSIMQALACGLPVIASDIPGINNLINGVNGVVVQNSVDSFAAHLQQLIENPVKRALLAKAAREYALQHLSQERMFQEYNSVVSDLCARERA